MTCEAKRRSLRCAIMSPGSFEPRPWRAPRSRRSIEGAVREDTRKSCGGKKMTDQQAPKSNPIRDSKNRVKLGVFATNGNGAAFTFHPDRYHCTWDSNVRLAQKAEKLGFEAFVSAAHWKAFGGDDHYSGDLMETFTWAGAVAAVTEHIGVISTVHVTVNHPV